MKEEKYFIQQPTVCIGRKIFPENVGRGDVHKRQTKLKRILREDVEITRSIHVYLYYIISWTIFDANGKIKFGPVTSSILRTIFMEAKIIESENLKWRESIEYMVHYEFNRISQVLPKCRFSGTVVCRCNGFYISSNILGD